MGKSGEYSLLIDLVEMGQTDAVKDLIEETDKDDLEAVLNAKTYTGNTAVSLAVWRNDHKTLEVLIAAGANIGKDVKDSSGRDLLEYAKERGFNEVAQLLEHARSAGETSAIKPKF